MLEKIQSLLSKQYAPAVQSRVSQFPSRDQLPLVSWLVHHPVGTYYALQILDHLEALAKRHEMAASLVLSRAQKAIQEDKLHPKELGKRIRDLLYQGLYQKKQSRQHLFKEFESSLSLPQGIFLKAPKNYEGVVFSLEINFGKIQELKEKLEYLKSALETRDWKEIEGLW